MLGDTEEEQTTPPEDISDKSATNSKETQCDPIIAFDASVDAFDVKVCLSEA